MRYFDRQGSEITNDQWKKLFRDPHYAILKEAGAEKTAKVRTIATWIGVHSNLAEGDKPKALFLVQKFKKPPLDGGKEEELQSCWCATEKDALKAFNWYLNLKP